MRKENGMKELFNFQIQLPFDDYACFEYEMTEEEFDDALAYCDDNGIWHESKFDNMMSAACLAAARYIVAYEDFDEKDLFDFSCTPKKLLEYLDIDEDYISEILSESKTYRIEAIQELLWEHEAFSLSEG